MSVSTANEPLQKVTSIHARGNRHGRSVCEVRGRSRGTFSTFSYNVCEVRGRSRGTFSTFSYNVCEVRGRSRGTFSTFSYNVCEVRGRSRGTFSTFSYNQNNAVKLTHVMLHSLACDSMKFGCFPKRSLAMRPDLVKQPVYRAAGSKPLRLGGPFKGQR